MPIAIEEMRKLAASMAEVGGPIAAVPQYIAVYEGGFAVLPTPAKSYSMRLVYTPKDRVQ